ncbi:AsmA family protein [Rhizobium sp. CG5]|uniref:AsmA family protein n=1 Tax=Rhizobium sp. CG5 TaxID=2726076 RepID=UPI0020349480|nr:AsmA-like C-terminal region-containing protein [Rhizobium sp. CG5]MCM2472879.1 AsmA family protein [Rhizobium sp. CG5]
MWKKLLRPDPRRNRLMGCILRGVGIVVLVALSIFVASRAAAPYLISSSLVRSAMEDAVAQWTGHDVTIAGTPQLQFWPEPRISLPFVTVAKSTPDGAVVLGRIDLLSAGFGIIDAIKGRPVFSDFHLIRPRVFIDRNAKGHIDWASEGLLSAAVRDAQPLGDDRQLLDATLDTGIGLVMIEDGVVELRDHATGRNFTVDGISARVGWPRLSGALKGSADLRLAGRDARIDFSSTQPLLLLGGRNGQGQFDFHSLALNASFDGIASLQPSYFLTGAINASTPDMPALLTWLGVTLPGTEVLKTASVTSRLTTSGDNLRLEDLEFQANDTRASGIMVLSPSQSAKPKVSGTLALETLDIRGLLGAFSLDLPDLSNRDAVKRSGLLDWLELDLTLSADQARLAPFMLEGMAASILATGNSMTFDIADSLFEEGRLTGHLEGTSSGFDNGAHLELSITDANLGDLGQRLALEGPLPQGPGSLDLELRTERPIWETGPEDIKGRLSFTAGPGTLNGADTEKIRLLAGQRSFFRLSEAADGQIPFDRLELSARFSDGSAEIDKAQLSNTAETLGMTGVIPFSSNGLALSAELAAEPVAGFPAPPPLRFFVGGSWPDPVISPITLPAASGQ